MPDRRPPGLDEAARALTQGRAAVLPNPSPLTYGVIATDPRVVNAAKGRPLDQEVGCSLHDEREWRRLVPSLDLDDAAVAKAYTLMRREWLTVLAPLRKDVAPPEWVLPGVRAGHVLFFGAELRSIGAGWAPVADLWAGFPRLYGSSANRTGLPAAATATEAREVFGDDVPVVDGDALHGHSRPHSPTTMLRIGSCGTLTLVRHGAQDATRGGAESYLRRLEADGLDRQ